MQHADPLPRAVSEDFEGRPTAPLVEARRKVGADPDLRDALTGNPALTLPFGIGDDGIPVGFQIAGAHFAEMTILRVAFALETMNEVFL